MLPHVLGMPQVFHFLFLASRSLEEKQWAQDYSGSFLQLGKRQNSVLYYLVQEVGSKILPIQRAFSPPHISCSFVFNKLLSPSCVWGIVVGVEVADTPIHIFQPKGCRHTTELWERSAEDIVGV